MIRRLCLLQFLLLITSMYVRAQDVIHERLTNLPHLYINTFSGYNIVSRTTMVFARMWYVDEQDQVTFYDSLQIRVRGNSTADLPKKPYKLKFNEKVKLLGKGRPNTKKWTLLANHGDKTLLRNALTSLMGERAGLNFNPAAKFVDLTVNNRYVGNYQLSDQVDVRPHRVNVTEQDLPLTDDSNITGGYLLEADGFCDFVSGTSGFYTRRQNAPIRIHYPDEDDIVSSQYSYISTFVQDFENRLFSSSFADPQAGYRQYVDSVSLANWYICTEICANVDGFFSTYFYKERDDDRLFWGPLWDYDIAYNNDNRSRDGTSNTEHQLMANSGYGAPGSGCREWVKQMWRDPWFARLINRRYKQLVDDGMEQYLNQKLDSLTELIDASQQLNFQRWGIDTKAYRERILYSTYGEYVTDVRTFLNRHIQYLTTAFAAFLPDVPQPVPEDITPDFIADKQYYYTIVNYKTGTYLDVDWETNSVCARYRNQDSKSQKWQIINLSNGYLHIVNAATGQALTDISPEHATATTEVGSQLCVAAADSTDVRQQWKIVSQDNNCYNLISRWSQHAANLSGGNADDGTPVLSYTSDERNSSSGNRLWRILKAEKIISNSISTVQQDYALAYNPVSGQLHFGADNLHELTFMVSLYNNSGSKVAEFRACDGYDMQSCPSGLYIVTWRQGDRQRSVKLVK